MIPYFNVAGAVFGGLRALLDDQVAPERRNGGAGAAAQVRRRRARASTPFAVLAEQAVRERMATPGLLWPPKAQVERGLADSASFVDGIPKLFEKFSDRRLPGGVRRS